MVASIIDAMFLQPHGNVAGAHLQHVLNFGGMALEHEVRALHGSCMIGMGLI